MRLTLRLRPRRRPPVAVVWPMLFAGIGCSEGNAPPGPTAPPGAQWNWRSVSVPAGDLMLGGIVVDPADDRVWHVWAASGLFVTQDAGASWMRVPFPEEEEFPYTRIGRRGVVVDPRDPRRVYAVDNPAFSASTLYLSEDRGATWQPLGTFDEFIQSLYVSPRDGALFAAPHGDVMNRTGVPGIYRSVDEGKSFEHLPLGIPLGTALITWQIAEDTATGTLFLGNEIADHPQPYYPPFLRSRDRGATWENVAEPDWWHASAVQVAPDGTVYALLEGVGLRASTDLGQTWVPMPLYHPGAWELVLDPAHPNRLFVGSLFDGLFLSTNGGSEFLSLGFHGQWIKGIALNGGGTKVHVVSNPRHLRCGICPGQDLSRVWVADIPVEVP